MQKREVVRNYSLNRLGRKVVFFVARKMPFIPAEFRAFLNKLAGVRILKPLKTFIGADVFFDDLFPEDIMIGENTIITEGVMILAHFVDGSWDDFDHMYRGRVSIGSKVLIGMNTVIVKPVTIGDGAIIGANSVVTKDIPPYTIWGGNPARFIKNRVITNKEL
jgi:acetyltransferase-like isoleucine patch superfamily enzyme